MQSYVAMFTVLCTCSYYNSIEDIIRKRLLVDGDGVSNDDRRLNGLIRTAVKWCSEKADVASDEER